MDVVVVVFIIIPLLFFIIGIILLVKNLQCSLPINAMIEFIEVSTFRGDYGVRTKTYTGSCSFMINGFRYDRVKVPLKKYHKEGQIIQIYVDPNNPKKAVIKSTSNLVIAWCCTLMPLFMMFIGFICFFVSL